MHFKMDLGKNFDISPYLDGTKKVPNYRKYVKKLRKKLAKYTPEVRLAINIVANKECTDFDNPLPKELGDYCCIVDWYAAKLEYLEMDNTMMTSGMFGGGTFEMFEQCSVMYGVAAEQLYQDATDPNSDEALPIIPPFKE